LGTVISNCDILIELTSTDPFNIKTSLCRSSLEHWKAARYQHLSFYLCKGCTEMVVCVDILIQ